MKICVYVYDVCMCGLRVGIVHHRSCIIVIHPAAMSHGVTQTLLRPAGRPVHHMLSWLQATLTHPNAVMMLRIPGSEHMANILADVSDKLQYQAASEASLARVRRLYVL